MLADTALNLISLTADEYMNALSPIVTTFLGMVILTSELQYAKALSPISVTLSGISMLLSIEQLKNA